MRDALDYWIAYQYDSSNHQFGYYARCEGPNCNQGGTIGPEILSSRIRSFYAGDYIPQNNYLPIQITACWDVSSIATCGGPENPSVEFRIRLKLPGASVR